jgi:hypothetical protein
MEGRTERRKDANEKAGRRDKSGRKEKSGRKDKNATERGESDNGYDCTQEAIKVTKSIESKTNRSDNGDDVLAPPPPSSSTDRTVTRFQSHCLAS